LPTSRDTRLRYLEVLQVSANEIREQVLLLARAGTDVRQAVIAIQARGDHRVPLVMAKRLIETELEDQPSDPAATRALEIIEEVLVTGEFPE
jgi:hypothetical protein